MLQVGMPVANGASTSPRSPSRIGRVPMSTIVIGTLSVLALAGCLRVQLIQCASRQACTESAPRSRNRIG